MDGMMMQKKEMKQKKMKKVMGEFKLKKLRSGSKKGKKVTNRKQAIAIGISEGQKEIDEMKKHGMKRGL